MTSTPAPGNEPPRLQIVENWQPFAPTAPGQPTTRRSNKTINILAALVAVAGLYTGAGAPLHYIDPSTTGRHIALYAALGAALVLLINVVAAKARTVRGLSAGRVAVTVGALVCTGVGLNTAWGFTHTYLGITDTFTRNALCGAGEIVLIALALAARDNIKRDHAAGLPGILVWAITGFLAVPAFAEGAAAATGFWSALVAGSWRAAFGPLAAALLWHIAMGLEIKAADATARSMSVLARLGRRLGQKLLAAFGIADTDTTTTELLRERARVKAANLTDRYNALSDSRQSGWHGRWIRRRLRAALRAANVAHDERQKAALLADLAISSHAPTLAKLAHDNPWETATTGADKTANSRHNDASDNANSAATGGGGGADSANNNRQNSRQDERQQTPSGGSASDKTAGGNTTGAAKKPRHNPAKKPPANASTRRPMDEWVKLAGPVFHDTFRQLRRQPTGPEFAGAIAKAGLGEVSASTAKNIRQAVLDNEPLPKI